jgi:hypothetical protein
MDVPTNGGPSPGAFSSSLFSSMPSPSYAPPPSLPLPSHHRSQPAQLSPPPPPGLIDVKGKGKVESPPNPLAGTDAGGPTDSQSDAEPKKKRKKASRACFACQRAHLTCDDGTLPSSPRDLESSRLTLPVRSTLRTLRQAWVRRHVPGWPAEEGQVPARYRRRA